MSCEKSRKAKAERLLFADAPRKVMSHDHSRLHRLQCSTNAVPAKRSADEVPGMAGSRMRSWRALNGTATLPEALGILMRLEDLAVADPAVELNMT